MPATISSTSIIVDKIKILDLNINILGKRMELTIGYGYEEGSEFFPIKYKRLTLQGADFEELVISAVDINLNIYDNIAKIAYSFLATKNLV